MPSLRAARYVLAFYCDLSGLVATRPEVLAPLSRMFWQALQHCHVATRPRTGSFAYSVRAPGLAAAPLPDRP